MTAAEAIKFLSDCSIRKHTTVEMRLGGGHGEPLSFIGVASACPCAITNMGALQGYDESQECTCGAKAHNAKVSEAVETLKKSFP